MLYEILARPTCFCFDVLFDVAVQGRQNIPEKGGCILASNHMSYLDPIALGVACPRNINFMARDDLFRNKFSRWLFSALKTFPVKRDSADLSALKEAMRRVRQGEVLVLFPEGTRSSEISESNAKSGIGFLAAKLKVPVIPTLIQGTDKVMPKGSKHLSLSKISVRFGIPVAINTDLPYAAIAQQIMSGIKGLAG